MNSRKLALLAALSAGFPLMTAQAASTTFDVKPVVVAGDDNVQLTALNDSNVVVGVVYAGITDAATGISISGRKVTTLPSPNAGFPEFFPRSINAAGDIFGWGRGALEGIAITFLLQNGVYNTAYQNLVLAPSNVSSHTWPIAMGLTKHDEVFFNTIFSLSGPVGTSYGKPPHYRSAPPVSRFTELQSINNAGMVAGTGFSFTGVHLMFAGRGKNFSNILPPGSINTMGGFLNNLGAVAGSYIDSSHIYHGFVYKGGTYTTFDMPEAATTISTTGINDQGRVVGTYVSAATNRRHAFLYNGTTVSTFGAFAWNDDVAVEINNKTNIIVADQIYTGAQALKYLSYEVTCNGSGC